MARDRLWVVPADGPLLADFLHAELGVGAAQAIANGRVFVDRLRVVNGLWPLAAGAVVSLRGERAVAGEIQVLGSRGGLIAVAKPAGIPTEPDRRGGADSLVHRAAALLRVAAHELHVVGRLDAPVSGVVLLAHGAAARRDVAAWREEGRLRRCYVALSARAPAPPTGSWEAPIVDGKGLGRRSRSARTRYASIAEARWGTAPGAPGVALLALLPDTGRTHQLRVHAAGEGCALLGDGEHGGVTRLVLADGGVVALERVALHAARLTVRVPDGEPWTLLAEVPSSLRNLWEQLGGRPEAWSAALTAEP